MEHIANSATRVRKKVSWTFWHSLGFASLGGDDGLNSKEEHVVWCGVKRGG
jgi:hypothetical protein